MTVKDIRDVNRLTVGVKLLHEFAAIQCNTCHWSFSADLARYHMPECGEEFACPNCDHTRMGLLFSDATESNLPLAQRRVAVAV